eukprot:8633318-Ditylum_brightwellii.AAC.1
MMPPPPAVCIASSKGLVPNGLAPSPTVNHSAEQQHSCNIDSSIVPFSNLMPLLLIWECLDWSGFVLFLLITAIMRGRGKFVVLCIDNGDKEQSPPLEEVLLVVLVVVEEVER